MNGSLQVKKDKYYMVIKIKQSNGKWSSKWFSTGIDAPKGKKDAEKLLRKTLVKMEEQEKIVNSDDDAKSLDESSKTVSEKSSVIVNSEIPIMIPVLTPSGQVVYAANIQAQRQTKMFEYIKNWLADKKKDSSIDIITYEGYESICNNHLIPYFKKRDSILEQIAYRDIQEYFNHEADCGNIKTKDGLSAKSLQGIKKVLSQIFKSARRDKLIYENPCEFVKLPKEIKKDRNVINQNQITQFFDKIKDDPLFPILYITLIYGLRRSEVLGLKWDSVNYDDMTVSIKHTVVKGKDIVLKDTTKNDSSRRTYPMSDEIKKIFLNQKKLEEENRKKYKKTYKENDYVFKWDDGELYRPDYLTRRFKKLLEENNMPKLRFRDLRHSCASVLVSNGYQLKDVQEWLGHSDIGVTANTYTHLFKDRKEHILDAMKF